MGIRRGSISTPIIADGLVFNMDAANRASYVPYATSSYNTTDLSVSGSFINDPTYISPPTSASCWDFDGVDDYIDVSSINLGLENTISFWIKRGGGDFDGMVWGGTSQSNYYVVYITHSEIIYYRITSAANQFNDSDIASAFQSTNWNNCILVRNNSGADVLCYINGELKQTLTSITGATSDTILENIGARGSTPLDFQMEGIIANAQLYNRALSANEVLHNYNALKGRFA